MGPADDSLVGYTMNGMVGRLLLPASVTGVLAFR